MPTSSRECGSYEYVRVYNTLSAAGADKYQRDSTSLLDRPDELLLGHLAPPVDVQLLRQIIELLLGARFQIVVPALRRRLGPALRAALFPAPAGGLPRSRGSCALLLFGCRPLHPPLPLLHVVDDHAYLGASLALS